MTHQENPNTLPARTTPTDPGWTPARQRYFLSRLSDTGNVLGVCREMDMSRQSVYALRARDAAFARAWQGAMLRHRDALVDICMERATVGVREEIVVDGALVERTKPDGAMLRHMLNRADRLCDDDSLAARPARSGTGRALRARPEPAHAFPAPRRLSIANPSPHPYIGLTAEVARGDGLWRTSSSFPSLYRNLTQAVPDLGARLIRSARGPQ